MKKITMIAAAAVAALSAAPAMAQMAPWDPNAFWRGAPANPYQRIQFLHDRVNRGITDGSLDPREASRVDGELNGVRQWIHDMHWEDGGRLTPGQRDAVQARLDGISRQIHWMKERSW